MVKASKLSPPPATVRTRRAYFDCKFGQLHVRTAFPATGGFDEQVTLFCLHPLDASSRTFSRFVSELDDRLSTYNEDRVPEMRIRLRVAMHMDVLIRSELGQAGPALVVLSRLLDDPALRAALREAPGASLALLVSGSLYQKVIMSGLSGLRPEEFRQIQIDNPAKDFRMAAFLRVPRFSPPRFGAAAPGPTATAPTTDSGGPSTPSPDSPTRTQAPVQSMSIGGVHIGGNVSNFTGDIVGGAKNA